MLTCNFNIACSRVVDESRRLRVISEAILLVACVDGAPDRPSFFTAIVVVVVVVGFMNDLRAFSMLSALAFAMVTGSTGAASGSLDFSVFEGDDTVELDSLALNLLRK